MYLHAKAYPQKCLSLLFTVLLSVMASPAMAEDEAEPEKFTFDNLVPVEESRVQMAYIDPDADFSVFERVAILEPHVAFRGNWQRDQNRSPTTNVRQRDMDRIKRDVATLFERVFMDRLEASGYEVVDVSGPDVLVVRPAIIDLDITAPDTRSAGRSRTFTAGAGAATLYLELWDSHSGNIIGRAADRRAARSTGTRLTWNNSVTNTAEAQRMMQRWADKLVEFLDTHYK